MTTAYPPTTEGVAAALTALGATEFEVAATLLAGGYRGQVGECATCPVATYLLALYPKATLVDVGENWVHVAPSGVASTVSVVPPPAIADFITAFDQGSYYELDVAEAGR